MSTDAALFTQYENEYCNKSTALARKIAGLSALSGDAKRRGAAEVDAELREAESAIRRMDMEARSLAPDKSRPLLIKVKDYKADLLALKEQLKKSGSEEASGSAAARAELGLAGDYYSTEAGQRERMLASTQRLEKTSERLQYGRQQLLETEELGVNILRDLSAQRETILRSRDTLAGTDTSLAKARSILSTMSKRIMTNKLIMYSIVAFLLLAIIIVIWAKLS